MNDGWLARFEEAEELVDDAFATVRERDSCAALGSCVRVVASRDASGAIPSSSGARTIAPVASRTAEKAIGVIPPPASA